MPEVSIVIPVNNSERTIERSLQSIANQTYKDFEVIVVDNNCVDSTINIVKSFQNEIDVKIVECKTPGIVPALNTGIKFSSGNWIARQDDDDFWYPEKLEKQMKFLKENPDVSIVGTQIRLLDINGNVEETGTFGNKIRYPTHSNDIKMLLLQGQNPLCHPSVVYSKRVVELLGGYEQLFPLAEDLQFWCKAIPHFNFANLEETLLDYTQTRSEKYDARVPLLVADMYYVLYKKAGIVQGERRDVIYEWQMKKDGHKHEV